MVRRIKFLLRIVAIIIFVYLLLELTGYVPVSLDRAIRPFAIPVVFITIGMLTTYIVSRQSGWAGLAKRYALDKSQLPAIKDIRFKIASARINNMRYNSCLQIGASEQGMILKMLLPLRFSHPTLLIPWSRISSIRTAPDIKVSLFRYYVPGEYYVVELLDNSDVDLKIFKHSLKASSVPQYFNIDDENIAQSH